MALTKKQIDDLVRWFENNVPRVRGWRFEYMYPGFFSYTKTFDEINQPDRLTVFFTPDHNVEGEVDTDVQDDSGATPKTFEALRTSLPLDNMSNSTQDLFSALFYVANNLMTTVDAYYRSLEMHPSDIERIRDEMARLYYPDDKDVENDPDAVPEWVNENTVEALAFVFATNSKYKDGPEEIMTPGNIFEHFVWEIESPTQQKETTSPKAGSKSAAQNTVDLLHKAFEILADPAAGGDPLDDNDMDEAEDLLFQADFMSRTYIDDNKSAFNAVTDANDTLIKRLRTGPFELAVRARTIYAEALRALARKMYIFGERLSNTQPEELDVPEWVAVVDEMLKKAKDLQADIKKRGEKEIESEVGRRFRLLEVDDRGEEGVLADRRRAVNWANSRDASGYGGKPPKISTSSSDNEIRDWLVWWGHDATADDPWYELVRLSKVPSNADQGSMRDDVARRGRHIETNPKR